MIKETIEDIRNDIKSKRDALLIGHQKLKEDSDDWNKAIIVISVIAGLMESIKMRLQLTGAGWQLLPIILSSITAMMASLIKFRNFNQRMETYLQSASLLTNTLLKARNHDSVDEDMRMEYNGSLEKIETALYPSERTAFLKQSQRNLIEIMSQEIKYYKKIDKVNNVLNDEEETISKTSTTINSPLAKEEDLEEALDEVIDEP
tara:strand:- start:848 stop:1459 length:612 start_codon:yes stop_codon:yes gene_type:complete